MADKTEAQEIAERKDAAMVKTSAVGAFLARPQGYEVHSLEEFQDRPNRIKTDYTFRDTKSLAAYLGRFQRPETVAFSNPDRLEIRVIVDHHDHAADRPTHCAHHATFSAQFTQHYKAWRDFSGKSVTQVSAGLFLEERATDVIKPDAASIMDMVMQFDALKKVTFRQSTRLHDGQRQFTYSEENEARGNVTLPEAIQIRVSVFEGQEPEVITVRVRYRIEDGSLRFQFEIHDQKLVENTAFERCEDALKTEVKEDLMVLRSV